MTANCFVGEVLREIGYFTLSLIVEHSALSLIIGYSTLSRSALSEAVTCEVLSRAART